MVFHRIDDPARLHALIDAILLIEVNASLSELLAIIVEEAAKLVGARYGALGVIASDGVSLSRFVTYGVDEATRARIGTPPRGAGVLGEVVHAPHAVRVDDLATHAGAIGFPANHPTMHRFLGVPVTTGDGHVFGNLYLTDRLDGEPFDEGDELLVHAFARAAGLVIDQATIRSQLREFTLAEERERLARDLHDTVIQRLFAVGLMLQLNLRAPLDHDVRQRTSLAVDELDTTVREIRNTIFEIDQDNYAEAPLTTRIRSLANEVAARLGVHVELEIVDGLDAAVAYRCANNTVQALREMLSNVARHSAASDVHVRVEIDDDMLVLSAKDNGVGFVAPVGAGRGLRNLSARAHELGGECTVESAIGRGTLVTWSAGRSE